MEIKVQVTPNPNSKKFIVSSIINHGEKVTFATPDEAKGIQLPLAIFTCSGVKKITMFGNTITVTKAHSFQKGFHNDWAIVLDKLTAKLDCWKSRYLSLGGQLTLLNFVLSTISTYYLSVLHLPVKVEKEIDRIRRRFL